MKWVGASSSGPVRDRSWRRAGGRCGCPSTRSVCTATRRTRRTSRTACATSCSRRASGFGLPSIAASLLGAWWLVRLSAQPPLAIYTLGGLTLQVSSARLLIAALLVVFVLVEWVPGWKALTVPARWMPLGGVLSGLAGGVSGMQGALRSAFLARAGMDTTTFVATGVAIACLIDVSRVGVYASMLTRPGVSLDLPLVATAVVAAFAGALAGRRYLERLAMATVRSLIAVLLLVMAIAMAAGLL